MEIVSAFQKIVGKENVIYKKKEISEVETTTFFTSHKVSLFIIPNTVEQIQECVKCANLYKLPLYPVSGGKNWGYGSKVPWKSGSAVISLHKINRIIDYNEELQYLTIEAGVTFQQVHSFLKKNGDNFRNTMIGSSPHASIVGNIIEKGVGTGLYGNRYTSCCNFEVILPNGDLINTGFGEISSCLAKNIYKWGIGPINDGLFIQSGLGIVTRLTIFLYAKSQAFHTLIAIINDDKLNKTDFIDKLGQLRRERTIELSMIFDHSSLFESKSKKFKEQWAVVIPLYSPSIKQAKSAVLRVKRVLRPYVNKVMVFNEMRNKFYQFFPEILKKLKRPYIEIHNSLFHENPTTEHLHIAYASGVEKKTMDLDKDGCGFMWFTPVIPLRKRDLNIALKSANLLYKKYKFPAKIHIIVSDERTFFMHLPIIFNRLDKQADKKAIDCYSEMFQLFEENGYVPYRMGIQCQKEFLSKSKSYVNFFSKIKAALDPNNILAPEKYGIGKSDE